MPTRDPATCLGLLYTGRFSYGYGTREADHRAFLDKGADTNFEHATSDGVGARPPMCGALERTFLDVVLCDFDGVCSELGPRQLYMVMEEYLVRHSAEGPAWVEGATLGGLLAYAPQLFDRTWLAPFDPKRRLEQLVQTAGRLVRMCPALRALKNPPPHGTPGQWLHLDDCCTLLAMMARCAIISHQQEWCMERFRAAKDMRLRELWRAASYHWQRLLQWHVPMARWMHRVRHVTDAELEQGAIPAPRAVLKPSVQHHFDAGELPVNWELVYMAMRRSDYNVHGHGFVHLLEKVRIQKCMCRQFGVIAARISADHPGIFEMNVRLYYVSMAGLTPFALTRSPLSRLVQLYNEVISIRTNSRLNRVLEEARRESIRQFHAEGKPAASVDQHGILGTGLSAQARDSEGRVLQPFRKIIDDAHTQSVTFRSFYKHKPDKPRPGAKLEKEVILNLTLAEMHFLRFMEANERVFWFMWRDLHAWYTREASPMTRALGEVQKQAYSEHSVALTLDVVRETRNQTGAFNWAAPLQIDAYQEDQNIRSEVSKAVARSKRERFRDVLLRWMRKRIGHPMTSAICLALSCIDATSNIMRGLSMTVGEDGTIMVDRDAVKWDQEPAAERSPPQVPWSPEMTPKTPLSVLSDPPASEEKLARDAERIATARDLWHAQLACVRISPMHSGVVLDGFRDFNLYSLLCTELGQNIATSDRMRQLKKEQQRALRHQRTRNEQVTRDALAGLAQNHADKELQSRMKDDASFDVSDMSLDPLQVLRDAHDYAMNVYEPGTVANIMGEPDDDDTGLETPEEIWEAALNGTLEERIVAKLRASEFFLWVDMDAAGATPHDRAFNGIMTQLRQHKYLTRGPNGGRMLSLLRGQEEAPHGFYRDAPFVFGGYNSDIFVPNNFFDSCVHTWQQQICIHVVEVALGVPPTQRMIDHMKGTLCYRYMVKSLGMDNSRKKLPMYDPKSPWTPASMIILSQALWDAYDKASHAIRCQWLERSYEFFSINMYVMMRHYPILDMRVPQRRYPFFNMLLSRLRYMSRIYETYKGERSHLFITEAARDRIHRVCRELPAEAPFHPRILRLLGIPEGLIYLLEEQHFVYHASEIQDAAILRDMARAFSLFPAAFPLLYAFCEIFSYYSKIVFAPLAVDDCQRIMQALARRHRLGPNDEITTSIRSFYFCMTCPRLCARMADNDEAINMPRMARTAQGQYIPSDVFDARKQASFGCVQVWWDFLTPDVFCRRVRRTGVLSTFMRKEGPMYDYSKPHNAHKIPDCHKCHEPHLEGLDAPALQIGHPNECSRYPCLQVDLTAQMIVFMPGQVITLCQVCGISFVSKPWSYTHGGIPTCGRHADVLCAHEPDYQLGHRISFERMIDNVIISMCGVCGSPVSMQTLQQLAKRTKRSASGRDAEWAMQHMHIFTPIDNKVRRVWFCKAHHRRLLQMAPFALHAPTGDAFVLSTRLAAMFGMATDELYISQVLRRFYTIVGNRNARDVGALVAEIENIGQAPHHGDDSAHAADSSDPVIVRNLKMRTRSMGPGGMRVYSLAERVRNIATQEKRLSALRLRSGIRRAHVEIAERGGPRAAAALTAKKRVRFAEEEEEDDEDDEENDQDEDMADAMLLVNLSQPVELEAEPAEGGEVFDESKAVRLGGSGPKKPVRPDSTRRGRMRMLKLMSSRGEPAHPLRRGLASDYAPINHADIEQGGDDDEDDDGVFGNGALLGAINLEALSQHTRPKRPRSAYQRHHERLQRKEIARATMRTVYDDMEND